MNIINNRNLATPYKVYKGDVIKIKLDSSEYRLFMVIRCYRPDSAKCTREFKLLDLVTLEFGTTWYSSPNNYLDDDTTKAALTQYIGEAYKIVDIIKSDDIDLILKGDSYEYNQ